MASRWFLVPSAGAPQRCRKCQAEIPKQAPAGAKGRGFYEPNLRAWECLGCHVVAQAVPQPTESDAKP
jgi:hypothetical protein